MSNNEFAYVAASVPKFEEFSKYLLEENLHFTALEYYYELLERGIDIQWLKDFFGSSANFETLQFYDQNRDSLSNYTSLTTLDSIDLQEKLEQQSNAEEQLKVLEFELRKKNEEIKGFRERLTAATIGAPKSTGTLTPVTENTSINGSITFAATSTQAHETRALRYLIYEHLLQTGCKMTALQFTEDCEADDPQDLDDWEDVGLNCERPPDLYLLLRNNWAYPTTPATPLSNPKVLLHSTSNSANRDPTRTSTLHVCQAAQTETDFDILMQEMNSNKAALEMQRCYNDATKAELEVSRQQLADIRGKATRLEAENLSLTQESTYWRNQLLCLKRDFPDLVGGPTPSAKPYRQTHMHSSRFTTVSQEFVTTKDGIEIDPGVGTNSPPILDVPSETVLNEQIVDKELPVLRMKQNEPTSTRVSPPEFFRYATEMLPSDDHEEAPDVNTFCLADTLDEIIVIVGSQLRSILEHLPRDQKAIALPLLIQAICLHPDTKVRDDLLRTLFNLFGSGTDLEAKYSTIILHQCRQLATCLGPQRIESELLPQIWSQLNERPSNALRKLLVSACGVIAPATPSRLRSSLLLSVLSQAIADEKDEFVRAATIRSLACVVTLMEDEGKQSQLVSNFEDIISQSQGSATRFELTSSDPGTLQVVGGRKVGDMSAVEAACNWLLPCIAEWCQESDSLWPLLVSTWLQRLETLCISPHSKTSLSDARTKTTIGKLNTSFDVDKLKKIVCVLERLVPFVFVHLLNGLTFISSSPLQSGPKPFSIDGGPDLDNEEEVEKEEEVVAPKVNPPKALGDCWECLFWPQCILGSERCGKLVKAYNRLLSLKHNADDTNLDVSLMRGYEENWPDMTVVQNELMMPLAQLLRCIQPLPTENRDAPIYLEPDPISNTDFIGLIELQCEDKCWFPWRLKLTDSALVLCMELCHCITLIGKVFGPMANQHYLCEPFTSLLMKKSVQGYSEFNLKALPSAIFAGYCCLLASTKTKAEFNQIKMLITNAVFLHARDSCSLHGVRAAILCLCQTSDSTQMALDVLLPALRSCASCADPVARRTASRVFHCLIGCLSLRPTLEADSATTPISLRTGTASNNGRSMPTGSSRLLIECWQLVSQLVRDDYASIGTASNITGSPEEDIMDTESADLACVAIALGPLFCLYSRMLTPTGYVADTDLKKKHFENGQICDWILTLLAKVMSMVCAQDTVPLETSTTLFVIQKPHWEALVTSLLQVINRLFPTCSNDFRDNKILPWLYRMTELNNMIPDLALRRLLAQRLISVFSTVAYCMGTEPPVTTWVMPGLDRLRLDFVEAEMKDSVKELEQLSLELRLRLANQPSPAPHPNESADTKNTGFKKKLTNFLDTTQQRASNLTKRG